jgi:hypothetical protein
MGYVCELCWSGAESRAVFEKRAVKVHLRLMVGYRR